MRPILCDKCSRFFRSKGMSRVMRKVLFHFCSTCWHNRQDCEEYMRGVTS